MSYETPYPRAVLDYRKPITITCRIENEFIPAAPMAQVLVLRSRYFGREVRMFHLLGTVYGLRPIYEIIAEFCRQVLGHLHERCPHCLGTGFVPCLGPAPLMTHMYDPERV